MTAPRKPVAWGVRSIHAEKSDLWMCDFGLATICKEIADGFCAWANDHRAEDGPFEVVEFFDTRHDLQPLWALVEKYGQWSDERQAKADRHNENGDAAAAEFDSGMAEAYSRVADELRATLEAMQ